MRRPGILMCLLALALTGFGCSHEQAPLPTGAQVADGPVMNVPEGRENAPPQYYAHYWGDQGIGLQTIDVVHGVAVPFLANVIPIDPAKGGPAPLGITFDLDGGLYMIVDWLGGPNPYLSELVKIDLKTGGTTYLAQFNNHFCGPEIDACGNLYTVGFQPPNPPNDGYYFSLEYQDKLCRIDKYTGAVTTIGNGTGLVDIMDLAFDSHGTLWATTHNKLYTISLDDGTATWVVDITGVPPAPPEEQEPMMVMSIVFDKHDVMYGTAVVGFATYCCDPTYIMRIDTRTGEGAVLGSDMALTHGGDTMPTEVRIAHRLGNGRYRCQVISLDALPAHLAHGDYVPGTGGHSCDCP